MRKAIERRRSKLQRITFLVAFSGIASAEETAKHNFKPRDGYVPDAKTAITIAAAVWGPIYGEDQESPC